MIHRCGTQMTNIRVCTIAWATRQQDLGFKRLYTAGASHVKSKFATAEFPSYSNIEFPFWDRKKTALVSLRYSKELGNCYVHVLIFILDADKNLASRTWVCMFWCFRLFCMYLYCCRAFVFVISGSIFWFQIYQKLVVVCSIDAIFCNYLSSHAQMKYTLNM